MNKIFKSSFVAIFSILLSCSDNTSSNKKIFYFSPIPSNASSSTGAGGFGGNINSTGTGGFGGENTDAGPENIVLSTCNKDQDLCDNTIKLAPFDGEPGSVSGNPYYELGDWNGVSLVDIQNRNLLISSVKIIISSTLTTCKLFATTIRLNILNLADPVPDPRFETGWLSSFPISVADFNNEEINLIFSQNLNLFFGSKLIIVMQLNGNQSIGDRMCPMASNTNDLITPNDLWFHHEMACDNMGQTPYETCGWKPMHMAPTMIDKRPYHWGITAYGTVL